MEMIVLFKIIAVFILLLLMNFWQKKGNNSDFTHDLSLLFFFLDTLGVNVQAIFQN